MSHTLTQFHFIRVDHFKRRVVWYCLWVQRLWVTKVLSLSDSKSSIPLTAKDYIQLTGKAILSWGERNTRACKVQFSFKVDICKHLWFFSKSKFTNMPANADGFNCYICKWQNICFPNVSSIPYVCRRKKREQQSCNIKKQNRNLKTITSPWGQGDFLREILTSDSLQALSSSSCNTEELCEIDLVKTNNLKLTPL